MTEVKTRLRDLVVITGSLYLVGEILGLLQ